jgi:hypothetical protein
MFATLIEQECPKRQPNSCIVADPAMRSLLPLRSGAGLEQKLELIVPEGRGG